MNISKHFYNLKFNKNKGIPFRITLSKKLYAQCTSEIIKKIFNTNKSLKLLLDPSCINKNSEIARLLKKEKLESISLIAVGKGINLVAWIKDHRNIIKKIELITNFDIDLVRPNGTLKKIEDLVFTFSNDIAKQ